MLNRSLRFPLIPHFRHRGPHISQTKFLTFPDTANSHHRNSFDGSEDVSSGLPHISILWKLISALRAYTPSGKDLLTQKQQQLFNICFASLVVKFSPSSRFFVCPYLAQISCLTDFFLQGRTKPRKMMFRWMERG